jgi:hypothetical protein
VRSAGKTWRRRRRRKRNGSANCRRRKIRFQRTPVRLTLPRTGRWRVTCDKFIGQAHACLPCLRRKAMRLPLQFCLHRPKLSGLPIPAAPAYFFGFTTCLAALLSFFCLAAVSAFACFCAACLFLVFGDLSPILVNTRRPARNRERRPAEFARREMAALRRLPHSRAPTRLPCNSWLRARGCGYTSGSGAFRLRGQ